MRGTWTALALVGAVLACSRKPDAKPASGDERPATGDGGGARAAAGDKPQATGDGGAARAATGDGGDAADFAEILRELWRVAACAGDGPVPAGYDAEVVAAHCALLRPEYESYRQGWLARARPFLAQVVPADVPKSVVYPFGGGDLITALATFPAATELTTISLEEAGDVRRAHGVDAHSLERNLKEFRETIARLMRVSWSDTGKLEEVARGALPGEVVFSLAALAAHGYEPVSLRYFGIQPDGSLHYYSAAELDAPIERPRPKTPRQPERMNERTLVENRFSNLELTFRTPAGVQGTYRHIAANVDDRHLTPDAPLLRHLEAKGKVAVMTKAASYLLWLTVFDTFRRYLLAHMAWMISDSTGISAEYAYPAGFEEIPYGDFRGAYEHFSGAWRVKLTEVDMAKLWKLSAGPLPFRYGYWDAGSKNHLMITRPRAPGAAPNFVPQTLPN